MPAQQPPLSPPTARVGGSGSAHAGAVGFVVVLVAMAWLGLSGRDDAPLEEPVQLSLVPRQVAVAPATPPASPQPRSTPLATRPPVPAVDTTPGLSVIADLPVIADGEGAYAVVGRFGEERYVTVLDEWRPDVLAGRTRLPFPRPATAGTISLVHLGPGRTAGLNDIVGIWTVPLDPLIPETIRGGEVLRVSQPGRPRAQNVPALVRDGFAVTVRAEGRLSFALLVIKVASPWHEQRAGACDGTPPLPRYSC